MPQVWLARDRPRQLVAEAVGSGRWLRAAHGVYVSAEGPAGETQFDLQRRLALASIAGTDRRLRAQHWFSHLSAALLWGLPVARIPTTTHVLGVRCAGGDRTSGITSHTGRLVDSELTVVSGLPATTLARTVADCLATLPPVEGLVVADAALHRGLPLADLQVAVAAIAVRRGSARARAVLAVADDGAESPGESMARFVVVRDGLPLPTTQVPVVTRLGTYWSDFGWEEWRLLVEYDGRDKYGAPASLFQEKRRHDALVEAGERVIRVTYSDLAGLTPRLLPWLPPSISRTIHTRRALASQRPPNDQHGGSSSARRSRSPCS
jgi:very-short-patch-repair endonuclease